MKFYTFAIIPLILEFLSLQSPSGSISREMLGEYRKEGDVSVLLFPLCGYLIYLVWTFMGLFLEEWPFFVSIIILNIISNVTKNSVWLRIDSAICILIILGATIYHIHF